MKILLNSGLILWVKDATDYEFWDDKLICFKGSGTRKRELARISSANCVAWWYDNMDVSLQSEAQQ